jgi:hypothetical protein
LASITWNVSKPGSERRMSGGQSKESRRTPLTQIRISHRQCLLESTITHGVFVITLSRHLAEQFRQPSQSFSPTRQSLSRLRSRLPLSTLRLALFRHTNGPGDCFVATYRNHASYYPQTQTAVAGHGREAETKDPPSRPLSPRRRYARPPLRQAARL